MRDEKRVYYSLKTLLGGDPDINKRMIYYGHKYESGKLVAIFNIDMDIWTAEDENNLRGCLNALNEVVISR